MPRPSIPKTGDIENPFIRRPSIQRLPIRARTSSSSEARNFPKMDDTVVPEQPIKRKRNDLSPEKTKTDGIKNEGDTFKKTIEKVEEIASRLALHAEKLKTKELANWLEQIVKNNGTEEGEKEWRK
ncbi:hypothetical protein JTB14_020055 [Gonioctena quinquepunctata]|nr:hypothetical protein JTB14_020055 [Gonioctena quinquepunctata]